MKPNLACILLAACVAAVPSHAQLVNGRTGPLNKPADRPKAAPLPDALPGATIDKERVAPSDKVISDLSPNDALFDGINRGDIATVRDAVNRGADLGSRSVLGQTPIDLSVDLGRNDITFLLLSLRGTDGGSSGSRPPQTKQAAARTARETAAELRAEKALAAKAEHDRLRTTGVAAREPTARSGGTTARQFATDGGAPVPASGFLGFGGTR